MSNGDIPYGVPEGWGGGGEEPPEPTPSRFATLLVAICSTFAPGEPAFSVTSRRVGATFTSFVIRQRGRSSPASTVGETCSIQSTGA